MPLSRKQRDGILEDLQCPILGAGMDDVVAERHGVSVSAVRRVRSTLRKDMALQGVYARARELAEVLEWEGPLSTLAEGVLAAEVARQRKATEYTQGLRRDVSRPPHRTRPRGVRGYVRRLTGKSRQAVQVAPVSNEEKSTERRRCERAARPPVSDKTPPTKPGDHYSQGRGRGRESTRTRPYRRPRSSLGS